MSLKHSNKNVVWKFVITALVLIWAVSAMAPFGDTAFEDYIQTRATNEQAEFAKVLDEASARVDPQNYKQDESKSPTLYIALRDYANQNNIDLSKYFDVNITDVKVLNKRNDILLKELYRQSKGALKQGLDLQGGVSFTLEIDEESLDENEDYKSGQLEDVLTVMNNRINGLGVTEPTIRLIGNNAIEVQMPGVSLKDNPEAIEELSRPAKLEFRLVHRDLEPTSLKPLPSEIPTGYEVLMDEKTVGSQVYDVPVFVKRRAESKGDIISDAYPVMEDANRFSVGMEFTSDGSKVFERITSDILEGDRISGTKQPLAIVLDGRLMSAPVINSVISKRGSITGDFTRREAIELANALNNPLAVGLKRTSLNEVGPSLASEARDKSLNASIIGASLVVLSMLVIYTSMGVISLLSVFANIVILVGVLASFSATLTLPGIAALVLTIGMAVDSNILVFERMREELKNGVGLTNSLELGYEKAFSTIVDANITTLISALILWQFGTGPVKGFGVTLAIGIFTTLFCVLVFSRAMLELTIRNKIIKKALTKSIIPSDSKIPFLNYAKKAFTVSWIIVLCGIAAIVYRGDKTLSIDFTGGDIVSLSFNPENKLEIGQITALSSSTSDEGIGEIQASYQVDLSTGNETLVLQVESEKGDMVFNALAQQYPEAGLTVLSQQSVGASVSGEITRDAAFAVVLSLIAILIYVAMRFEFSYGVGAIVATSHDVLMTIGLFVILGLFGIGSGQFSSPMVASILMVMGYSINDNIVVFDRIREELKSQPDMTLAEVINYSANRTLSRTLLTSITTLLASIALFIFGTGIIVDFSLVFIIGIIVGTFSSIFIASPVFYWWNKGDRKNVEKEHADSEAKPKGWEMTEEEQSQLEKGE